jgi:hypothetical protein
VLTGTEGCKGKSKLVPLQAWSGPEDSRKLRFPDFMKTAQDSGKVGSLTHREGGGAGTNYWGPAVRKGTRGPTTLHMFLSFSVLSLFVVCTN